MNATNPKEEQRSLDAKSSQVADVGRGSAGPGAEMQPAPQMGETTSQLTPIIPIISNWGAWKSFSKTDSAVNEICVGTNADQRLEVLAACADGTVVHNNQLWPGGAWSGWQTLAGASIRSRSPIVVAQNHDGRMELFGLERSSAGVLHIWQTEPNGGWSEWESLGAPPGIGFQSISVERDREGCLELLAVSLFAPTTDGAGQVWRNRQIEPGSAWQGWESLSNPQEKVFVTDVIVVRDSDGVLQAFTLGVDLALRNISQARPAWTWRLIYQFGPGDPVYIFDAVRDGGGLIELFVKDVHGNLWTSKWHKDRTLTFFDWAFLGMPPNQNEGAGSIAVIPNQEGVLQAFTVMGSGGPNNAWTIAQQPGTETGWGKWQPLGAPAAESITSLAVGRNWDGRLGLFCTEFSGSAAYLPQRGLWSQRLVDAPEAFEAVCDQGVLSGEYRGSPLVGTVNAHIQGMASYGKYYILTHNAELGSDGDIFMIDKSEQALVQTFPTPEPNHPHPGGCQVIGDYLAISLETADNNDGIVRFYYLGELTDDALPTLLPPRALQGAPGAGAVGITDVGFGTSRSYVIAVYDSPNVTFYRSNGRVLEDSACAFTRLFTAQLKGEGADNLCLLTDVNDDVYLVALTSDDSFKLRFVDWAQLYRVDLLGKTVTSVGGARHMVTHGGPFVSFEGIHFRYGAGIRILNGRDMEIYCSSRNFVSPTVVNSYPRLAVNVFHEACDETESAQSLDGQTNADGRGA